MDKRFLCFNDNIFIINNIIYIEKGENRNEPFIRFHCINDELVTTWCNSKQERDEAFEKLKAAFFGKQQ